MNTWASSIYSLHKHGLNLSARDAGDDDLIQAMNSLKASWVDKK